MEKLHTIVFNTCIVEWCNRLEDCRQICAWYLCRGSVVDYTGAENLAPCLVALLDVILVKCEMGTLVVGYFQNMPRIKDFSSVRQEECPAETTLCTYC